jgi:hypothetical protein
MWASRGADVGESRRRCGRVAAQMWAGLTRLMLRCAVPTLQRPCRRQVSTYARARTRVRARLSVQLGPWHKPSRGPTQYSGGRSHRPSVSCRYLSTRSVSSRRGAPTMLALPARLARTGRRSAVWMERQRSRASGRSGGWKITTQWDTRWQPRVPHLHRDRAHRCHIFTGTGMRRPGGRPLRRIVAMRQIACDVAAGVCARWRRQIGQSGERRTAVAAWPGAVRGRAQNCAPHSRL